MKHRVLYTSVGLLSGHQVGDVVDVADESDAAHLLGLGLIEPVDEEDGDGQTGAEALKADQDRKLEPFNKGGGWYHFVEGETLVKVQGRDKALVELEKRNSAAADSTERE